jgi:YVTN family beta-propeller protein
VTSPPNTVYIIDTTNTDKDPEIIKVGNIPIDLDFDLKLNKIYVANNGDNTVSVIDGTNYDLIKNIPVGKSPNSIVYNPNDNKVYVTNKGDKTVSVINCSFDMVVSIFGVGNNPTSININIDQNILYVVNNLDYELTAVDKGNNLRSHPLMKNLVNLFMGNQPSELNINKIPVSGHPSAITLDYGNNTDNRMLYVTNTDSDTISVIDGTKKEVIEQFKVGHKPTGIDINNENGRVYVSNSMSNTVSLIDSENKLIKNIPTKGKYPTGLAVDEKTNLVYVANTDSDTVSVIDGKTNKVKSIQVGNGPTGIAIDSKNNLVYVTNYNDDTISIINASNHMNYGNIDISRDFSGNGPTAIAVDSTNNEIYVLNMFSNNIAIIGIDLIIDSLQNNQTIDPSLKYVNMVISAGDTPSDISLSNEEIYVTNRDHNITNIINMQNFKYFK